VACYGHKPRDEKRALVILSADEYDGWLNCRKNEIENSFLTLYLAKNEGKGVPSNS